MHAPPVPSAWRSWIRCLSCLAVYAPGVAVPLAAGRVSAADPPVVQPAETWSCVFGGSEVKFGYAVASDETFDGRFAWRFSIGPRTVLSGERAVYVLADESVDVLVPLLMPPVREGVVVEGELRIDVMSEPDGKSAAGHVRPVWIFPRSPFVDRTAWLKSCEITLFDPEGETAAVLEKEDVPFRLAVRTGALAGISDGMLLVGEGISLQGYRGLPETLYRAASSGIPVLLLAPSDGSLPLPGVSGSTYPSPQSLRLRRSDVIREMDKRLDANGWLPDDCVPASRFSLVGSHRGVSLEIAAGDAGGTEGGWPWVEIDYNQKRGKMIMCGFRIIRRWESGPVPRFLLVRLLEELTEREAIP